MSIHAARPCRFVVTVVLAVALALAVLPALPALAATNGRAVAHAARHHRHRAAAAVNSVGCADTLLAPSSTNLDRIATATLCLINRERASHRLVALRPSAALSAAAARQSQEMVAGNYFDHVSRSGSTPLDRVRQAGYITPRATSYQIGENIAAATGSMATPAAIVRMWMSSPGHRANILSPGYRDTGIGVAPAAPRSIGSGPGGTYTEDFGSAN